MDDDAGYAPFPAEEVKPLQPVFISELNYNFPIDDNITESTILVGNTHYWQDPGPTCLDKEVEANAPKDPEPKKINFREFL